MESKKECDDYRKMEKDVKEIITSSLKVAEQMMKNANKRRHRQQHQQQQQDHQEETNSSSSESTSSDDDKIQRHPPKKKKKISPFDRLGDKVPPKNAERALTNEPLSYNEQSKIRDYMSKHHKGTLTFMRDFMHDDYCCYKACTPGPSTDDRCCTRWNFKNDCSFKYTHRNGRTKYEHCCQHCLRILNIKLEHKATCDGCPINKIRALMYKEEVKQDDDDDDDEKTK